LPKILGEVSMRYFKFIVIVVILVIGLAFAVAAQAGERCENSVSVDIAATVRFVTIPDAPPMTAAGSGDICYVLGEKSAKIVAESVPPLVYAELDPPDELNELTVIAEVIPGTTPHLEWTAFPEVELAGVDIRVRAYAMKLAAVTSGSDALVDVIFSDLSFSTGKVEAEGVGAEGYIDAETMTAVLVGKALVPPYNYSPYKEWLADQPVLIELKVRMRNPYGK